MCLKSNRIQTIAFLFTSFLLFKTLSAQVYEFTSSKEEKEIIHRIIMDEEYFIETQFMGSSSDFILTRGGFFQKEAGKISVIFEFNSNYANDSLKQMDIARNTQWQKISESKQPLDGKWLMAGRVRDEGERRRNTSGPRKTMKILKDGYFQWTAFNTETFQFFGSGGGAYKAQDGSYTESIEYFSRDNNKVGLQLEFDFEEKGNDWYHKGFSSKGDPMHEIWTQRKQK